MRIVHESAKYFAKCMLASMLMDYKLKRISNNIYLLYILTCAVLGTHFLGDLHCDQLLHVQPKNIKYVHVWCMAHWQQNVSV